MEKSIYGFMQTRPYYESIWLEGGIAEQLKSPTSNFSKSCEKCYGIWKKSVYDI
jgi:hypothetical protein